MEEFSVRSVDVLCLSTSLAISGIFYYHYRKKRKTVDKLNDAPLLTLNGRLPDILNATPGKCLQYVVIEGTVQPVGQPLRSQFQESTVGVVQKLMLKEHKLVWNGLARMWMDSERVLHQRVNSVPFSLVGADEAVVRVLCPLDASGLDMEVIHEEFHQATFGFSDIIGTVLSGEKPKGQLETEQMLKVGAALTGVGELILDTDRILKLRPPANGSAYFLTTRDFETLRAEQESQGGAVAGAGLHVRPGRGGHAAVGRPALLRHLKRRWDRERLRREFEGLETAGPGASQQDGTAAEVPMENACVICLSRPRGCVLLDCGHVCCCFSCYQALPQPNCPMCRQRASGEWCLSIRHEALPATASPTVPYVGRA